MAKKRTVRRKPQAKPMLSRVQAGVKKMQRNAKALVGRARKEAARLSHEQKRGFDRVATEVQRLRSDFDKLVRQTSKDIESRSRHLLTSLEKDIDKRLEPILRRLTGPSRQEVQNLAQRVHQLEQLVKQHTHAAPTTAPPVASPPPVTSPPPEVH